ncbi:MAG: DUF1232 domain-containing protein [Anaerolineae bacterium]
MSKSTSPSDLQETAGLFGGLIKQARLAWRLLKDERVPGWVKLIPTAALIYFLSPIDLIPDLALPGLGEVDDIMMILIALKMFLDLSPPNIVREHLEDLFGGRRGARPAGDPSADQTIDATYRVLDDALSGDEK